MQRSMGSWEFAAVAITATRSTRGKERLWKDDPQML